MVTQFKKSMCTSHHPKDKVQTHFAKLTQPTILNIFMQPYLHNIHELLILLGRPTKTLVIFLL